jgi:Peptidase propeptide and YPEB domain
MRHAIRRMALALTVVVVVVSGATGQAQKPSSAARPATLPAEAMKAFKQAYPDASITTTLQDTVNGRTVFRVDSIDKDRRRVVVYDARGAVLQVAEQVEEQELPPPVAAAMHSQPGAIFVSAMKVTEGKTTEYRLTLRGSRRTAMVVKPDGTVLSFK